MAIVEQIEEITKIPCDCCGFMTVFSSGFVVLESGDELEYVARWTDGRGDHDIFFLVYVEEMERYASVVFSFEEQAFSLLDPKDSDWGDVEASELIERKEIINTELSHLVFSVLNEVMENDKSLVKFTELVMVDPSDDEDYE